MKAKHIIAVLVIGIVTGLFSFPTAQLMIMIGMGKKTHVETYSDLSPKEQARITPDQFHPYTQCVTFAPLVIMALAAGCTLTLLWRHSILARVCWTVFAVVLSQVTDILSVVLRNRF
jgi:hypothetical protein